MNNLCDVTDKIICRYVGVMASCVLGLNHSTNQQLLVLRRIQFLRAISLEALSFSGGLSSLTAVSKCIIIISSNIIMPPPP